MARKNIQGITIEIGGDTTKLQTALKGVEGKLKDTQAALKDVNKLLKLDPGNVELLTQKQQLLGESIDATKDKLKTLEQAQEEMAAAGKVNTAEYDALQREIIDTEQQLKSLTGQMKEFGSVSAQQLAATGKKVQEVGDKISKVGAGMTKYVTGPIVAVGAASVAAFNEVDEGLDQIAIKTGATGEALADMQDRAKNLATSIPTDFATAGEAVGEVNTRFNLTGDALEELSGKFIKFAKLNNTDVSSSVDSVQSAMAAFGIDASRAGDVLDILQAASQETGVGVDKLSSSLASNATALREMGYSMAGSTMFLARLEKNGVDSSTAVAGLRTALKNATKDGKSMAQTVGELQNKIAKASNKTEAMAAATELFGSKAGPALGAAMYEGRLSLDELTASMSDFAGSVDNTFEETLDPMDEFKTALNELKIVGMELVEAAAPMIKSIADTLKNAIGNLRNWWEDLSPLAQQTVVKLAGIAAAVGPVLAVVGKVTGVVGGIMEKAPQLLSAISSVKTAIAGIGAAIAANPVGAAIAALAALIAGLVALYKNCEDFRNFVNGAVKGIVSFVTTGVETVIGALSGLGEIAVKVGNGIKEKMTMAAEVTGEVLREKWANIKKAYEEHGGGLKGIAAATVEAIKARFTTGFDILNQLTGGKLDGIKQAFSNAFEAVKSTVKNAIERIKSFFNFHWELPKIKLPHFSITGKFSLNPPSIPHFSVDWYKKAMQDGMILSSPTIFPAANGTLRGFGDAGPEAVVGVDSLRGMIASAVSAAMPRGTSPRNITIAMYLNNTMVGRALVPILDAEAQRMGVRLTSE